MAGSEDERADRPVPPDASRGPPADPCPVALYVLFGRPGAGKTTLATSLAASLLRHHMNTGVYELDDQIPDWMRHNFAAGVYPTAGERAEFAAGACAFLDRELVSLASQRGRGAAAPVGIVSFSFVNDDLRDFFRMRFPSARWFLVDTDVETAGRRIRARSGHFYKIVDGASCGGNGSGGEGKKTKGVDKNAESLSGSDRLPSSEWNFAPVKFPHVRLDGMAPVDENVTKIVECILKEI
mmetsp:Transcript_11317/g.22366  ORF Transcript_11317/g.22366 Transcript_11317/m.22366 type:complete len:239 (-) Transcript_11317:54-770(-)